MSLRNPAPYGGRVPAAPPRAATASPPPEPAWLRVSDELTVEWAYGFLEVDTATWDGAASTSLELEEALALRDYLNKTLPKETSAP